MKQIVIAGELNLQLNSARSEFPEESGLYLVHDGISNFIVFIEDHMSQTDIPMYTFIPYGLPLKDYEPVKHTTIRELINRIEEMYELLENINDKKVTESSTNIDLSDVTKLIAVAQKPDLIKE